MVIYPGTFDPITVGHLDVLFRTISSMSDSLVVAVADIHDKKKYLFNATERVELIRKSLLDLLAQKNKLETSRVIINSFVGCKVSTYQIEKYNVTESSQSCNNIVDYIKYFVNNDQQKVVFIVSFNELLVKFAKKLNIKMIVRGIRASSDFDYEFNMSCANKRLDSSIETVFIPSSEDKQFISSSIIKSIASLDGDVSSVVTESVVRALKDKYNK